MEPKRRIRQGEFEKEMVTQDGWMDGSCREVVLDPLFHDDEEKAPHPSLTMPMPVLRCIFPDGVVISITDALPAVDDQETLVPSAGRATSLLFSPCISVLLYTSRAGAVLVAAYSMKKRLLHTVPRMLDFCPRQMTRVSSSDDE